MASAPSTTDEQAPKKEEQQFVPLAAVVTSPEELEYPLSEDDGEFVEEIEEAWAEHLKKKPAMMPLGKRGPRLNNLRALINEVLHAKSAVEGELSTQLGSLQSARNALEEAYQHSLAEERQRRKLVEGRMMLQLDSVAIAGQIGTKTIGWNHFLKSVDDTIVPDENVQKGRQVKPSARAMALVDPVGDVRDIELRAFLIDNALLKAQVRMQKDELQGLENTAASLEGVGQLLAENNVWSILTPT